MSLISIIMPAYNCAKFIEDSVNSVINQSYSDWELIIIEDCSTDDTLKICENISMKDSRIKIIASARNNGVSYSRNVGIDSAQGSWIAFLDSDDLWDPYKLEKQLRFAEKVDSDFIFTGVKFIDEHNQPYNGQFKVPASVSYKELLKQNVISCSSVLIKKESLYNHRMENDKTHEDFGLWLKVLKNNKYAYGINEPLLIYRISKNSKSGNKFKSVKMTYKTYRLSGLNFLTSLYYTSWYIIKSLKKYRVIKVGT